MRFKPPPPNSPIGWRIEFRPCELQFTDFENAAVVCFVVLVTRVILSFRYNLLIPISKVSREKLDCNLEASYHSRICPFKVDENMKRAQKRDAVLTQKFFFRTNITTTCANHKAPIIAEMTVNQIINGDPDLDYPGLLPLVRSSLLLSGFFSPFSDSSHCALQIHEFLRDQEIDTATMCTLSNYWKLIKQRASGQLKTNARFMRDFVLSHPDYKQDSVVGPTVNYDLIKAVVAMQTEEASDADLLGGLNFQSNAV